ncbi:hypothetical protein SAMN06265360_1592 [Haloechinothrix alba]|uniref:Uncharacterized protein n=1 Tax=Haloechinothrix alba TaxID=664784 RepID=A0A239AT56_9PSEU|nr:hypothetical protein [Haloechinothrix alba]SNR98886.1 hypothetical protein SAMN06265360_1592 [Haloechinothrix alba]
MSARGREPDAEHLAALRRSVAAGFGFVHLHDHGGLAAIHAERWRDGAVDTVTVRAAGEALAARYRAEDYGRAGAHPLWQATGSVADVVDRLLELPPHGTPAAPSRAVRPRDQLWLPQGVRL